MQKGTKVSESPGLTLTVSVAVVLGRIISVDEGVEKREPSYTVGGNVNWCSHYGEQCVGSSKN